MKNRPNARTTAPKQKMGSSPTKKTSGGHRETVPIISASETSLALTREAAKELLLLETQNGGKLHGVCLIPDATLESMERLLALVGREDEIRAIRFRNTADYGVEIRQRRPKKR